MLIVQVTDWAQGPKVAEVPAPEVPADDSLTQVKVLAAGLLQLVKGRATGTHYSASNTLPHFVGVDGTGIDVKTGKKVYFMTMPAGNVGSYAEFVNLPKKFLFDLPDGVDPVQAAALVNAVMSSLMALTYRVDFVKEKTGKEWTCLILGAAGMAGRMAVKVARQMGATKVIGAARNEEALKKLGLDSYIVLQESPEATDFSSAADVDVVLDYLWGPWPNAYLAATNTKVEQTWVNIGAMAGADTPMPSASLRGRNITFRGAGPGAWPVPHMVMRTPAILEVLKGVQIDEIKTFSLEKFEEGWNAPGRIVFVNKE